MSEIAGRLGKPSTALSRPLRRLLDLGLIERQTPFGVSPRSTKRSLYRIGDPFLAFWFRFVEPNRSRLEARQIDTVLTEIRQRFPHHVGEVWEEMARSSVPALGLFGQTWGPAGRYWGPGTDRRPLEIDVVAESTDGRQVLVGEVERTAPRDPRRLLDELERKAERLPFLGGRTVRTALGLADGPSDAVDDAVVDAARVLDVTR